MVGVTLASQLLTGCIIPDPPEYGPPQQTPIFIEESTIAPDPRNVLVRNENDETISFSFKVRSEDAGDRLYAVLYADYKHTGGFRVDYLPYEPLTFDQERSISLSLQPSDGRLNPPKCYAITLMVVHEKGYDVTASKPIGAPSDLASVTWLLGLGTDNAAATLDSCPSSSN